MTTADTDAGIDALRRENAALRRWIGELREALDALLRPTGPDAVSQVRPGTFDT